MFSFICSAPLATHPTRMQQIPTTTIKDQQIPTNITNSNKYQQMGQRWAPKDPRGPQDVPKMAQEGLNMGLNWHKMASRWLHEAGIDLLK